jgi:hypothetical protein
MSYVLKLSSITKFFLFFFFLQFFFPNSAISSDKVVLSCDVSKEETEFLLSYVKKGNRPQIRSMDECKKANRKLFAKIIDVDPRYFGFASDSLKDDQAFIGKFVAQNPIILNYISNRLKADRFFMSKMMRVYPHALKYASPKLTDNKGFMADMINLNPRNFQFASYRLQADKNIALLAVKNSGKMLKYASDNLQDDKEVVLEAIKSYNLSINFASIRLQDDREMQKLSNTISYNFLSNFDYFLRNNYKGIAVGPGGSRGYHIVNMAKFSPELQAIYRPYVTKWERVYENGVETSDLRLAVKDVNNFGWELDFIDYPDLTQNIKDIFAANLVDENTVSALNTISLWQVSDEPEVVAFNLYLLRQADNKYLKSNFANITSLTAIARLKDNYEWEISIVDAIFDADLQMNIAYKSGHKRYKIWDIYKDGENDKEPKILFKVEDKDAEYFELFVKQLNGRYASIYRGGGYAMNITPF